MKKFEVDLIDANYGFGARQNVVFPIEDGSRLLTVLTKFHTI